MPLAIDRETVVAAAPRDDRVVRVRSLAFGETAAFDLDDVGPQPRRHWIDYAHGTALALDRRGALRGADLAVGSTLPLGGGLSSSAAFEIAVGAALLAIAGSRLSAHELAEAGREAENAFVGVQSGGMDQLACAFGVRGAALLIDCRTGTVVPVPLPNGAAIALVDSGARHALGTSAYNARRAESAEAARMLGTPLLDLAPDAGADAIARLPEPYRRRARHVVTENARVRSAVAALRAGDLAAAGAAMNASHASLRDDYEVSTPELDRIAAEAQRIDGVYGARMTGGGFGGSVVIFARESAYGALAAAFGTAFTTVRAAAGAGPL